MDSEKVEEQAPQEQVQQVTNSEVPASTSEVQSNPSELTQEKKDACKFISY